MDQTATAISTAEILGLVWTLCVGLGVAALAAKVFNGLFVWSQKPNELGGLGPPKMDWTRFGMAIVLTTILSLGLECYSERWRNC